MKFGELYGELVDSTEMIRALLKGITQREAQFKKNQKTWSILEVTCHLYDEEREDFREHIDLILFRQKAEWGMIDPQSWITQRKYNSRMFESMKTKFFHERSKSLTWLGKLKNVEWSTRRKTEWGVVTAGEMFASWVAHDNLHIRQLVELRRIVVEQKTKPYNIRYAGEW